MQVAMTSSERFPFSRRVDVQALPARGTAVNIVANDEECAALARDLDLPAVHSLSAELLLSPFCKTGVRVAGRVRAKVTQSCVVTLEPVEETVDEAIDIRFLPADEIETVSEEIEVDPETEDPPEPLETGDLDVGQIVAEHLALGLDPYPRAPGATFDPRIEDAGDEEPESPFAKLRALKGEGQGE
ncbi:hypothetical protein HDIA_2642 [Hartmannibacter diazotrophicus]|uniref:ACR n=1 Tax=Hartmannibacter diazotrophicus TaxID=1482074 RepID=A0A2C9D7G7_9HYPH|nr:hypothetical protein HDIA_2642 [Hartmannibacter diazotrophicus]